MYKCSAIEELDKIFKNHHVRPENYIGAGACGFVVGVLANEKPCVVKVEISRRANGLSALEREVCTFRIARILLCHVAGCEGATTELNVGKILWVEMIE